MSLAPFTGYALAQSVGQPSYPRGIWVSVFSDRKVLYSPDAVQALIGFCRKSGVNEIYLQIYQSGRAYYDSKMVSGTVYEKMVASAGSDPIDLLLRQAHAAGIKVYAWVNALSVGANTGAYAVSLLGASALTRDQHGRTSLKTDDGALDKYYLRETQDFLDPGDYRVREFLINLVAEIADRYPAFDGLHLDYLRYPYGLPFVPGSRFNDYGLTYGYAEKSMAAFKKAQNIDPLRIGNDREYMAWDAWKRERVTLLLENLRRLLREKHPAWSVSAAVLPVWDRAYNSAFQDWPRWLEEGIVDSVVLMNYTLDDRQFDYCARSGAAFKGRGKVYSGIGVFLMQDVPGQIRRQERLAREAGCDGAVFFSYSGLTPAVERALSPDAPAL